MHFMGLARKKAEWSFLVSVFALSSPEEYWEEKEREREREVGGKRDSREKEMKRKYRQPDTRYTETARRIIWHLVMDPDNRSLY
jgi:hypothetical protein